MKSATSGIGTLEHADARRECLQPGEPNDANDSGLLLASTLGNLQTAKVYQLGREIPRFGSISRVAFFGITWPTARLDSRTPCGNFIMRTAERVSCLEYHLKSKTLRFVIAWNKRERFGRQHRGSRVFKRQESAVSVSLLTPAQLRATAVQCGMSLTDEDVASFRRLMQSSVESYNIIGAMPDEVPPVKYPRTPGCGPSAQNNPRNAWYRKSTVKGVFVFRAAHGFEQGSESLLQPDWT